MRTGGILLLVVLFAAAGVAAALAMAAHPHSRSSTVNITEREMSMSLSRARVPTGKVTFAVRNAGEVQHEVVVMRWSGDARRLPLKSFKVREKGIAVGEVPELEPNHSGRATLRLTRGRYVLICNIPGHYMLGMSAVLTVS